MDRRGTLDYYLEREKWPGIEETDSQKRKKKKWGNGERERERERGGVVPSGSLLLFVRPGRFMDNPIRLCRVNSGNLNRTRLRTVWCVEDSRQEPDK
jgi:hypothetical protein